MSKFELFDLFAFGFVLCLITRVEGESSTCLTVYKEGGAPAVFQSPKCPRWKLTSYDSQPHSRLGPPMTRCQSAVLQGRRKYQEDRTFCALDILIPFPGPHGIMEVAVGIVAVFDGHNGAEASEMASMLLLEYFMLHTHFLLDPIFSVLSGKSVGMLPSKDGCNWDSQKYNWHDKLGNHLSDLGRIKLAFAAIVDGSFHLEVLKEALMRAIRDIDATFSKEASRNNLNSGSTATVILMADGQILVANVGDSKAFLCSEIFQSPQEAKATLLRLYRQRRLDGSISSTKRFGSSKLAASNGWTYFLAKELTRDHHPDREDERSRVESSGGYVAEWAGVSRINGQLAVSRSIGDVPYKSYGVISVPEVTDWQPLTANDSYLVAASDGVFEKLNPQDICDLFWELDTESGVGAELTSSCSESLADCIVNFAFEKGSMDNMAAVVLPFGSIGFPHARQEDWCDGWRKLDYKALEIQGNSDEQPADDKTSELMESNHPYPVISKFNRLLVEGQHHSTFGCFYLSENLNENYDDMLWVQKDNRESTSDLQEALPSALLRYGGGPLDFFYNDHSVCLHFGMDIGGDKGQCINPESFAKFLGLLESIPILDSESSYGPYKHETPDSRYILKKRFGRGAYGEVWLAFHWNCSGRSNGSNWSPKNTTFSFNYVHRGAWDENLQNTSHDCNEGPPDDNMFILKRIMVERGTAVYLSGIREKYFGEVLRNSSTSLRDPLSARKSDSFWKESVSDLFDFSKMNKSAAKQVENAWSFDNILVRKKRQMRSVREKGLEHIARYVESFRSKSDGIWLVFRHEGVSLSKLLYTAEEVVNSANEESNEHVKRVQVLHPSSWWHWLKTTKDGQEEMRNLIKQLLLALKSCHDRNITHRDIKPENMVICFEEENYGKCLKGRPSGDRKHATKMRIIDFGSAMDEFTMKHLYGSVGPSRAEQTYDYSPPEALLNSSWYKGPTSIVLKYDMWSVGVVILELILGSPDVFQVNALTHALLDQHLDGWNDDIKELAYRLRSFMEMCILIPGSSAKVSHMSGTNNGAPSPASWKCSEDFFSNQIKSRDPLKIGFPNVWALRLVRQLLLWDPEDRLSVEEALTHPYFSPHSQG